MIERIQAILNGIPEVSAWKLTVSEKQSSQLFYVGKKLETNRASDTTDYVLTIKDDKGTSDTSDDVTYTLSGNKTFNDWDAIALPALSSWVSTP